MCQFFSAEQTVRRWAPLGRLPALIVAKFSARQKLWKDIFDSTTRKASLIATLVTENNFHLTRNSLMSPWPVRMVRWWKPTKWSWLAPVTNKPSLAGKGWGFLKCFGRTEECWHQNWVYAGFLLATLYTSWTVCFMGFVGPWTALSDPIWAKIPAINPPRYSASISCVLVP